MTSTRSASARPPARTPESSASSGRLGRTGVGLLNGFAAYGLWGLLPLYFAVLGAAGAVEIVANRVAWSVLFCVVLLTVMRGWTALGRALTDRRVLGTLAIAAVLIAINWLAFAYAITTHQAIEGSLGYFINPLVSVVVGVLVLHEKLRRTQWVAVGIGALAVVVLAIAYGKLPWIALVLAFSFGFYGLVKNQVGGRVDALTSLTVETVVLLPLSLAVMLWLTLTGQATLTAYGPGHFWLMVASGVITALPLLFFGGAARRLPLSTVGLLQYLAPVLQFIFAILVLKEHMPPERWIGFSLVWVALLVLIVDAVRQIRRRRRPATTTGPADVQPASS
ncbi:EamA family transporter RarD [Tersicoccus mangrovi]|uniref:EamA family transporter RarD n=1 Tax=Tersicoccus mangrovi TaxID=3121635 RepID=UPI003A7F2422